MPKRPGVWIAVYDDYFTHPKILAVGERAAYEHLRAISWSRRQMTDGFIEKTARKALNFDAKTIEKLVTAGLWITQPNGWQIHDYADCQQTREEVEGQRKASVERQRRSRENRKDKESPASVTRDTEPPVTRLSRVTSRAIAVEVEVKTKNKSLKALTLPSTKEVMASNSPTNPPGRSSDLTNAAHTATIQHILHSQEPA